MASTVSGKGECSETRTPAETPAVAQPQGRASSGRREDSHFLGSAASPSTAPHGCTSGHIGKWAEVTAVSTRQMAQETLTLQHAWARDGAGGQPRAELWLPVPGTGLQLAQNQRSNQNIPSGTMH